MDKEAPIRLQRYLALCGIASRRRNELHILDGRVTVNGVIVRVLGTKVGTGDKVLFDGKPVLPEKRKLYIALNKPRGYLCSSYDPDDRPIALDLFGNQYPERLYNVGRLDFNTSGLILFTNDGDFAKVASHPSSEVEKEYIVESFEPVNISILNEFKKGIVVDGVRYRISDYQLIGPNDARLTLIEGKNREIRRLYEAKDITIRRIHRVRIGPVRLGDLETASHRMLTKREVGWFFGISESKRKGGTI
jgi:23S rRNA pseudouridine2605 synthase